MLKHWLAPTLMALTLAIAGPAWAEGDAKAGARVFKKCQTCHTLEKGGKNKVGPNLWGVVGAKSASRDVGFKKFTKAMRTADLVWDEPTLDAYLKAPRKFLKGTKMAFPGLRKEQDRANVIAYLIANTK